MCGSGIFCATRATPANPVGGRLAGALPGPPDADPGPLGPRILGDVRSRRKRGASVLARAAADAFAAAAAARLRLALLIHVCRLTGTASMRFAEERNEVPFTSPLCAGSGEVKGVSLLSSFPRAFVRVYARACVRVHACANARACARRGGSSGAEGRKEVRGRESRSP